MPAAANVIPLNIDPAGRLTSDLGCASCGRTLSGLEVGGFCGQCGQPVLRSLPPDVQQRFDAEGRLAIDVACRGCGYNLRMQPVGGRCPECSRAVADSAFGFYLHLAAAQWIKRLARGSRNLVIALAAMFIFGLFFGLLSGLLGRSGAGERLIVAVFLLLAGGGWILAIAGLIDVTAAEPNAKRDRWWSARRTVRHGLILGLFLLLAWIVVGIVMALDAISSSSGDWAFFVMLLVALPMTAYAISLVVTLALVKHLGNVMRRVPRPGLVTLSNTTLWMVLIGTLATAVSWTWLMLGLGSWMVTTGLPAATAAAASMPYAGGTATAASAGPNQPGGQTAAAATTQRVTVGPTGVLANTTATSSGAMVPTTMAAMPAPPANMAFYALSGVGLAIGGCVGSIGSILVWVLILQAWRVLRDASNQRARLAG